ncbi:Ser/Thr protein phosphatase family protein [Methylophaga thiooxydans]|uniref:Ser/Thr protein phosphatase family protein n=2 Tax=Methylophaga thiooxydans TaxID=392484 RepID=C0N393_9GAMM|nr:metallophosphoesterase [Methylophaga thiooxydans]EEF80748.1 Ser/Thr protein phosphatase family protein [Methylophaga thiooxydans DMS010]KGM07716.1 Ser/Thr protein phosphatase family protein [Methylophaga thiooxydans]
MKFQLYSDIHIETRGYFSIPKLDSDLIVLAGDIDIGLEGLIWAQELTWLHKKPVIYIAGNHEYYRHDFVKLTQQMRDYAAQYDQLIFLEKDEVIINDVRFLGTTLWTNYLHELGIIERDKNILILDDALYDHKVIRHGNESFSALKAYEEHLVSERWLRERLMEPFDGKTVVITHHAPSFQCNHIDFGMNLYSPGFASNLDVLVAMADVWCYGHTHSNLDATFAGCRLLSNQAGYKNEKKPVPLEHKLIIL